MRDRTTDFASAAMMRLVAAGLGRQGLVRSTAPIGAHVQRAQKREVLAAIEAAHGALAILQIADVIPELPPEPVMQALIQARDGSDLLDRWSRLERFSHARHRLTWTPEPGGAFHLTHHAIDQGPEPTGAETLLVVAVVTVMVEQVTGGAARLTLDTGEVVRSNSVWLAPLKLSRQFQLKPVLTPLGVTPARALAAHDEVPGRGLVEAVRGHLLSDPVRRWTVDDMALRVGTSSRTLQRRLARAERPFARLLAECRLQVAAEQVCLRGGPSLAEVGFLSGYADQAHFTRAFSRSVGIPPAAFRTQFGISGVQA